MTDYERKRENKEKLHAVFIARILQLCEEKGYSTYKLSYKSSVSMTTLLHMLDGDSMNPGLYNIVKICDGLDVTLAEFFDTKEFEEAIIESRDEK